jgi:hypothetical protein
MTEDLSLNLTTILVTLKVNRTSKLQKIEKTVSSSKFIRKSKM